jgi:hypothetical protein
MKHDRKLYTQPKAGIACTGHPVWTQNPPTNPNSESRDRRHEEAVAAPIEDVRNIALYAIVCNDSGERTNSTNSAEAHASIRTTAPDKTSYLRWWKHTQQSCVVATQRDVRRSCFDQQP